MNFDLWENERNKATVLSCGLKVLRDNEHITVLIWRPKAIKPYAHYKFRTIEAREQYISEQIDSFLQHQQRKIEYKAQRSGTPEMLDGVRIGDIFHWSWGYDQTNCDFFQVVDKSGSYVFIREIGSRTVEGSQGMMCDNRVPVKDLFVKDKTEKKKLSFSNGKPYLSYPYGWCELWDGKPCYCSWYA